MIPKPMPPGLRSAQNESDASTSVPDGWRSTGFTSFERRKRRDLPWWAPLTILVCAILGTVGLAVAGPRGVVGALAIFVAGLAGLGFYFWPSFVAYGQKHRNADAIFVCNLLFGWTFLGWGIALVWACKKD
jgi:hypothetical protein